MDLGDGRLETLILLDGGDILAAACVPGLRVVDLAVDWGVLDRH